MRRRDLIAAVVGAVLRPLAGAAQTPQRRLIATLTLGTQASGGPLFDILREALRGRGYGNDKIAVVSRWADGYADRLPGLAAELVRLAPDVIVAGQAASARALKQATATIPIVFAVSDDPVGIGLVASLAHPGGNVTGLSFAEEDTIGRALQLLKTIAPGARRIAVMVNPTGPTAGPKARGARQAAPALQIEIIVVEAGEPEAIGAAFRTTKEQRADAILVVGDGLFTAQRRRIIALAASERLPAIYHDHIFVEDGGLMSFGGDFGDNYRRAAVFVDKILKGAKPADLPVEEPTKFYLYINQRTANALGLAVPGLLLAQADEVVE